MNPQKPAGTLRIVVSKSNTCALVFMFENLSFRVRQALRPRLNYSLRPKFQITFGPEKHGVWGPCLHYFQVVKYQLIRGTPTNSLVFLNVSSRCEMS
jgi:hypothetical protein